MHFAQSVNMKNNQYLHLIVTLIVVVQLAARSAHAYLDMASGSMFFQVVTGGISGLMVVWHFYRRRVIDGLKRIYVRGNQIQH